MQSILTSERFVFRSEHSERLVLRSAQRGSFFVAAKAAIRSERSERFVIIICLLLAVFTSTSSVTASTSSATDAAADHDFSGRVVDASSGLALAGASVMPVGTDVSVMTDSTGCFKLSLPTASAQLEIVAPGYESALQTAFDTKECAVRLFHQSAPRASLPMSSPTLSDALSAGMASFLKADSYSGELGSGAAYTLRGRSSINLPSHPLFVVDGVVWQMQDDQTSSIDGYRMDPLTLIDPADVERVEVLRNGSAVWGSQGAGGVVLISTRRSKTIATRIDADVSAGIQTPGHLLPVMNAESYRRYATELLGTMSKADNSGFLFVNDDRSRSTYPATHNDTSWPSQITAPAFFQRHSLSVSGGDEVAVYRFSIGVTDGNGCLSGTGFNRLNVRFNSDIHMTDRLLLPIDISFARTNSQTAIGGMNECYSPLMVAWQKSPLYSPWQFGADGSLTRRLSDVDELGKSNPLALVGEGMPTIEKYRFVANARPSYRFSDQWRVEAWLGFSWDRTNEDAFIPDMGVADEELLNAQGEVYAVGTNRSLSGMARQRSVSVESRVTYHPFASWKNDWVMSLGGRYFDNDNHQEFASGYNTGSDYIRTLGSTSSDLRTPASMDYDDRVGMWYLTSSYSRSHRYFVDAELAMETHSRYGRDGGSRLFGVPWTFTPGLSGRWVMSAEEWMKSDRVNLLQFRANALRTGNDALPLFANRNFFVSNVLARDAQGLIRGGVGNDTLSDEKTDRFAIGADIRMADNRLGLSVDAYYGHTHDLVVQKQMPESAGAFYYWDNDGALVSKGLELSLDARVVERHDWRLDMAATMTRSISEVTELGVDVVEEEIAGGLLVTQVGSPVGVFYGYRTDGVFATQQEADEAGLCVVDASGRKVPFNAGDIRFKERVEDGVIDDKDRFVIGNPAPDLYGAAEAKLTWKRWSLEGHFTYALGGDVYGALRASLEGGSTLDNQSTAMTARWVAEGQQTDIPRIVYGDPMGNARFSDRWIEDGSYLKLRRLALSYELPIQSGFLQGAMAWVAVQNVFTLSSYLGTDPAVPCGIDMGASPAGRNYMIGIKFNL